jgi:TetR/AcrR family fatty acid metabolism transcriptional regulator
LASKDSGEDTKSRLIMAATKVFAEHGHQKATVSEIAKLAGLSESAIYEYFQGKEDLLLAIPDVWVSRAITELEEQLFGIKGAQNQLRKFLWWYIRYIEREPLIAKVVFLTIKGNRGFVDTQVYNNVRTFYSRLITIFQEGISAGEFRPDLNVYVARSVLLGTIEHIVIRWLMKDMTYSLFDNLEQIFSILMNGIMKSEP